MVAGRSSGSKIRAAGIFRIDNNALDPVDQLQRALLAVGDRLDGLAPAAIQKRVGRGDACRWGSVLVAHDLGQRIDRATGVTSCQRANFGDGSGHRQALCGLGLRRHKGGYAG